MKLELKHLAPYLPYGLKVQFIGLLNDDCKLVDSDYIKIGEVAELGAVEFRYTDPIYWMDFKRGYFGINSINFKPILRPLSDLTKEIDVNGEKFIPIDYFVGDDSDLVYSACLIHNDFSYLPYNLVEKLFEWHFDVFGLIEQG